MLDFLQPAVGRERQTVNNQYLYLTVGDRQRMTPAQNPDQASGQPAGPTGIDFVGGFLATATSASAAQQHHPGRRFPDNGSPTPTTAVNPCALGRADHHRKEQREMPPRRPKMAQPAPAISGHQGELRQEAFARGKTAHSAVKRSIRKDQPRLPASLAA
jgi:hypothetical protein